MVFRMYYTNTYTNECGYLLIQQASSISNNNNLTSQNFNSFSDEKNIFRTLKILSCCIFLVTFFSKRHLWKLMLMLLLFLHIILFEIVHNLSFCDNSVDLIDLKTNYLGLDIDPTLLLCPFISELDSSVVESSLRNPWIGGSNPGRNYTFFSVRVE